MRTFQFILLLPILLCCKTPTVTEQQPFSLPAEGGNSPMSCIITGEIIEIRNDRTSDKEDICANYPCKALVKIMDIQSCGSSVTIPIDVEETVEMDFAFTLHYTRAIFPKMKQHYPGLKKGSVFTAPINQRLRPATSGTFVVYGYQVK